MAEPQGDFANVAGCLEGMHRAAVAKNVRGDPLARNRWLRTGRGDGMLGEDIFESGPGHRVTGAVEEERGIPTIGASREPSPKGRPLSASKAAERARAAPCP